MPIKPKNMVSTADRARYDLPFATQLLLLIAVTFAVYLIESWLVRCLTLPFLAVFGEVIYSINDFQSKYENDILTGIADAFCAIEEAKIPEVVQRQRFYSKRSMA